MAQLSDKQVARLESLVVALQELVDSLRGKDVELPAEIAERIATFRREKRCLYCELPLTGKVSRGCHAGCYVLLTRRIKSGETTKREVVARGWMDPHTEPSGRKPKRPDPMRETREPAGPPPATGPRTPEDAALVDKLKSAEPEEAGGKDAGGKRRKKKG
jgi:hypothetical protein